MPRLFTFLLATVFTLASAAPAQQVPIGAGSVADMVARLKAGQYVWAPQVAPRGPTLLIVNLATQRATLFRNGVPIAASTISTGRRGYATPTGVFTILQKHVKHYSSKYDSAPMPYMQRLTWYGVALHAGHLPGYPASHGCIRLPAGFARQLYGVTSLGMTVVITDRRTGPRIAPTPDLVAQLESEWGNVPPDVEWHPERSPSGPISIVVSTADRRAVVLRNGIIIGSAPVMVEGPVTGTIAYALRDIDAQGHHWVRVAMAGDQSNDPVPQSEWQRFKASSEFRKDVAAIIQPGTTIVVTPDSLKSGGIAQPVTVIEAESKAK